MQYEYIYSETTSLSYRWRVLLLSHSMHRADMAVAGHQVCRLVSLLAETNRVGLGQLA